MFLLLNLRGAESTGFRQLYTALRQRVRRPVLALTLADPRQATACGLTADQPLLVSSLHEQDLFCFVAEGRPHDLLLLGLQVVCPEPPRAVIIGPEPRPVTHAAIDSCPHLDLGLEAARRGLAAATIEVLTPDEPDPASRSDRTAPYAADVLANCPWRELAGRLLDLRLPAVLPAGPSAPRAVQRRPVEPVYQEVDRGDAGKAWRLQAAKTDEQEEAPEFRLLDPERCLLADEGETLAQRLAEMRLPPAHAQDV